MPIRIGDRIRLTCDIPELELPRGASGVVQSTWFAPAVAYEVEFRPVGERCPTRALLLGEHLEPDITRSAY